MSIHMIKLSVGSLSIQTLAEWQQSVAARRGGEGLPAYADHITRMTPKRKDELLAGGSIYWVIKGIIQCRNKNFGSCRNPHPRRAQGLPYCASA